MKEHAWKTTPASCIEWSQNISSRNRVNDFPPQDASRCEPVNVGLCECFRGELTQFLHSSERHFSAYAVMRVGTGDKDASNDATERVHTTRFSGGAVHLPSIASAFGQ